MKIMSYNPAEIMQEIESRAAWIEYRAAARKNKDTTYDEFMALSSERRRLEHDCAVAVEKCLARLK